MFGKLFGKKSGEARQALAVMTNRDLMRRVLRRFR